MSAGCRDLPGDCDDGGVGGAMAADKIGDDVIIDVDFLVHLTGNWIITDAPFVPLALASSLFSLLSKFFW